MKQLLQLASISCLNITEIPEKSDDNAATQAVEKVDSAFHHYTFNKMLSMVFINQENRHVNS